MKIPTSGSDGVGAGGTQQFFTAQLAKRCGRPYVVAPLAQAAVAAPGQGNSRNEPLSVFDPRPRPCCLAEVPAARLWEGCAQAVHLLGAQDVGVPAPFTSTPLDTVQRGVTRRRTLQANVLYG